MPVYLHSGSSPRVRGRPQTRGPDSRGMWAHPRGCGADRYLSNVPLRVRGSSPRVRGRPPAPVRFGCGGRLIPAGAGQTTGYPLGVGCVCGSSPRVRGRRARFPRQRARLRLIPAGAGQTPAQRSASRSTGAHPRGCGADSVTGFSLVGCHGSSPRVRGRRACAGGGEECVGLIPAGAGQTIPCSYS